MAYYDAMEKLQIEDSYVVSKRQLSNQLNKLLLKNKGEQLLNLFCKGPCWDSVQSIVARDVNKLKDCFVKTGTILRSSHFMEYMLTNLRMFKQFKKNNDLEIDIQV